MRKVDFLLVGGGVATAKCAEVLRKEGTDGSILIVSADNYRPYHRPPLSKGLLLGYEGKEKVFFHNEEFYKQNKIDLLLNTQVVRVAPDKNIVTDNQGNDYEFGKLLLATGASPRVMKIKGGDLKNIFYLRSLDHSMAIKDAMGSARSSAIIGGGFIGMELASAFIQSNIPTTMIIREDELFGKLGSKEVSDFFLRLYQEKGVAIWFQEEVTGFLGGSRVEKLITKSGRELPCDVAIIGIGVIPETTFLEGSGIEIRNGIVTNEYLKTSFNDIYAAGDVANFYDSVFRRERRVEHWDNANKQGELVAKNMLGQQTPYNIVSYFFSDIFDISFDFLGDNSDTDDTVTEGSFEEKSLAIYYLKDKIVRAAFLLMRPPEDRKKVEQMILDKHRLI